MGLAASVLGTQSVRAQRAPIDVPGASQTYPYAIDGGNIVGEYLGPSGAHGLLYDGTTWTTLDLPGAIATIPYGIDDSKILGRYFDASGKQRGFLCQPEVIPAPGRSPWQDWV
jgi:hypothetical protein